jgi:hypothetical protein
VKLLWQLLPLLTAAAAAALAAHPQAPAALASSVLPIYRRKLDCSVDTETSKYGCTRNFEWALLMIVPRVVSAKVKRCLNKLYCKHNLTRPRDLMALSEHVAG